VAGKVTHALTPARELRIAGGTGSIRVRATGRSDLLVKKGELHGLDDPDGPLTVSSRTGRIDVEVPEETDLVIGTGSGSVEVKGRAGRVAVTAGSGSVTIGRAAEVDVRADRGAVSITSCAGECRVTATSGRATIRSTGTADVSATSGRLTIDKAHGAVRAKTVSGRLTIGLATPGDVHAESVAGQIVVKVPSRIRPTVILRSEWNKVDILVPEGDDCTISVESVRGRLIVEPA
jgi:DUF4097 and DUF4098 domain-containing protein YvlB